jgi:hypothetical protein
MGVWTLFASLSLLAVLVQGILALEPGSIHGIRVHRKLDVVTPSQYPEVPTGSDSSTMPRKASKSNLNSTVVLVCVVAGVAVALASTAAVVKCVCLAHGIRHEGNADYDTSNGGGLDTFNACAVSEYGEHESASRQTHSGSEEAHG